MFISVMDSFRNKPFPLIRMSPASKGSIQLPLGPVQICALLSLWRTLALSALHPALWRAWIEMANAQSLGPRAPGHSSGWLEGRALWLSRGHCEGQDLPRVGAGTLESPP